MKWFINISLEGGSVMAKMLKYMVVHKDPNISWEKVEENWAKLAKVEKCTWVRTFSFESIIEVEETVPDLWGKKWEEHLEAEEKASTLAF
jgi:hypothetical protein